MSTVHLTMAQALVRYLTAQFVVVEGTETRLFAGVWAIFGHGNVGGLGEALYGAREQLPSYRAHNEQAMAHAAIAYAKQKKRRQLFACTASIGPGATNMVTAAALAHVNRLPVLLLPGDVFASRRPDPVLQQIEGTSDGTVTANDCFKPVSRYFDRISRPEQILQALPMAISVLTDPVNCGPVTLALCQDVQAEAFDYPESFFRRRVWPLRRPAPEPCDLALLASAIRSSAAPIIIAGGGVKYSGAEQALTEFSTNHRIPLCETQAGKGAIEFDNPLNLGAVGVTGTAAANTALRNADLILVIGSRLQDFTTGSAALFNPAARILSVNVCPFDACKLGATPIVADAKSVLDGIELSYSAPDAWVDRALTARREWDNEAQRWLSPVTTHPPTDTQVLGALMSAADRGCVVVGAAGGLPGLMHKFWRTHQSNGYHMEYGYSCMGYEIAGGVGVKLAEPERDVYVLVGDGSYLMMNSEIATAAMMGLTLTIVVVNNGGFGCIHRLQRDLGCEPFNNLLGNSYPERKTGVDFVAHAKSLGATAEHAASFAAFAAAVTRGRAIPGVKVIVVETDPSEAPAAGGAWWDVAVPQVSGSSAIAQARSAYEGKLKEILSTR
jgi:3D-(3,5/4)-trihydroxycyclohexane-1,2-dione acylhydrolase (decyclizing)